MTGKKILYLHGLEAGPFGKKAKYLADHYCVHAPSIDYTEYDTFDQLSLVVESGKFDLIVGSSMGAFVGLGLSSCYGIPIIAINPPMKADNRTIDLFYCREVMDHIEVELQLPNPFVKRTVVVGLQDEVVDPMFTKQYFDESPAFDVSVEEDLAHRCPVKILAKYV